MDAVIVESFVIPRMNSTPAGAIIMNSLSEDELRIIVTGGRGYEKAWRVFEALEVIRRNHKGKIVVIEGGASGADYFAERWAITNENRDVEHHPHPADWKLYGLDAGRIRNGEMLREEDPHAVLAFPGGRGTRNMVRQSRDAGVIVIFAEDLANIRHAMGFVTDKPEGNE